MSIYNRLNNVTMAAVVKANSTGMVRESVPEVVEIIEIIILSLVSLVGTIGNLMTIFAVIQNRKLQRTSNVYIINLAVVDLIVSAFLTPISIYTLITHNPPIGCNHVVPFISMLCTTVSILNFSTIAINRYIAIIKGKKLYQRLFRPWRTALSVVMVWLVSGLVSLPPLVGFGYYGYDLKFGICFVPGHNRQNYWYIFGICFVFASPFLLTTTFSYTQIIRKFYKVQKRRRSHSLSINELGQSSIKTAAGLKYDSRTFIERYQPNRSQKQFQRRSVTSMNSANILSARMQERHQTEMFKVAFNCIVVWVFFLIAWIPILALHIIDYYYTVPAMYYRILFALAYTNFAVNAIIYAGLNQNFRMAYKRIILCGTTSRRLRRGPVREMSSTDISALN